jgi:hypothetical protein
MGGGGRLAINWQEIEVYLLTFEGEQSKELMPIELLRNKCMEKTGLEKIF